MFLCSLAWPIQTAAAGALPPAAMVADPDFAVAAAGLVAVAAAVVAVAGQAAAVATAVAASRVGAARSAAVPARAAAEKAVDSSAEPGFGWQGPALGPAHYSSMRVRLSTLATHFFDIPCWLRKL